MKTTDTSTAAKWVKTTWAQVQAGDLISLPRKTSGIVKDLTPLVGPAGNVRAYLVSFESDPAGMIRRVNDTNTVLARHTR